MKQTILFSLIVLLGLSACSNSSDDNSNNPSIPNSDLSGNWKVTYFWDKDKDETSDFNGYTFEFKSDGTFVAHLPGGSTQTGTWGERPDDGVTKLDIVIPGAKPLDDHNEDWVILEKTDTSLKLRDDNTTQLEEIHFSRQ